MTPAMIANANVFHQTLGPVRLRIMPLCVTTLHSPKLTGTVLGHHDHALPPPMFGQRQMLPPSPTHYQPRFSQNPAPSPSIQHAENRNGPPPQHRPGSSMSISSMLGSDNDKPSREPAQPYSHNAFPPFGQANAPTTSMSGAMSPPQHTPRPSVGEYSYKPRSQTPEQFGFPNLFGVRPHRSSSGSMVQRPNTFGEQPRPANNSPFLRQGEPAYTSSSQSHLNRQDDMEQARRTSIPGLMQRPSSQPQHNNTFSSRPSPFAGPSSRPSWLDHSAVDNVASQNSSEHGRRQSIGSESRSDVQPPPRQHIFSNSNPYDTRPPGFSGAPHHSPIGASDRDRTSQSHTDTTSSHPTSPDVHRQISDPITSRGFGRLLNDQPPQNTSEPPEPQPASQPMTQQDSTQSQSERSIFGDKLDKSRQRLFSPFAGSVTSQPYSATSALPDDQRRKGSDEISQHRLLLAESKRGRYSPLPQAVQGAQAQSVGPEGGIKTESGRVFSGIGSGIPTSSIGPVTAIPGLSASPFKRDDGTSRLSEENLMKVSRSTPGVGKRPRKLKDEELRATSEIGDGRGTSVNERGKKARHHQ